MSRTVEVDDDLIKETLTGYNNEEVDIINDKLVAPTSPSSPTNSVIQLIKVLQIIQNSCSTCKI